MGTGQTAPLGFEQPGPGILDAESWTGAWGRRPGTYALLLIIAGDPVRIEIPSLGRFMVLPQRLAYVGSAHGPGGLEARLRRHWKSSKVIHWHVDHLTRLVVPARVLATISTDRLECRWVQRFLALPGAIAPIPGFGSSDCPEGCASHLIGLPECMNFEQIKETLGS